MSENNVYEAKLVITLMAEDANKETLESYLSNASLETIGREMVEGDLLGQAHVAKIYQVPNHLVEAHAQALGSELDFFFSEELQDTNQVLPEDTSETIRNLSDDQGWNDDTKLSLALEFIKESGLDAAFIAHLEETAELENSHSRTM